MTFAASIGGFGVRLGVYDPVEPGWRGGGEVWVSLLVVGGAAAEVWVGEVGWRPSWCVTVEG
eukprot:12930107-Prorocentrum_lima.AAC.1